MSEKLKTKYSDQSGGANGVPLVYLGFQGGGRFSLENDPKIFCIRGTVQPNDPDLDTNGVYSVHFTHDRTATGNSIIPNGLQNSVYSVTAFRRTNTATNAVYATGYEINEKTLKLSFWESKTSVIGALGGVAEGLEQAVASDAQTKGTIEFMVVVHASNGIYFPYVYP